MTTGRGLRENDAVAPGGSPVTLIAAENEAWPGPPRFTVTVYDTEPPLPCVTVPDWGPTDTDPTPLVPATAAVVPPRIKAATRMNLETLILPAPSSVRPPPRRRDQPSLVPLLVLTAFSRRPHRELAAHLHAAGQGDTTQ